MVQQFFKIKIVDSQTNYFFHIYFPRNIMITKNGVEVNFICIPFWTTSRILKLKEYSCTVFHSTRIHSKIGRERCDLP